MHGHILQRILSLLNELPCHSITSVLTTYTQGSERTVVVHSRSTDSCSPTSGYLPSAICRVTSGIYPSLDGDCARVDAGLNTCLRATGLLCNWPIVQLAYCNWLIVQPINPLLDPTAARFARNCVAFSVWDGQGNGLPSKAVLELI